MSITDLLDAPAEGLQSRLKMNAQDLLNSLLGMRGRTRALKAPRARIRISVYSPNGRSAVAIRLGPVKG
ncbi:hypothetical protein [Terrarubrum flagellatum]|uniref:hypothetical protein n=1 Tax=Terrirubrum flagellatum TaxID=2895980 RepID=UPI00314567F1